MPGYILLEGGAEFGGQMALPDRRAIELAGGNNVPICILPTAAAPDHNDRRAGGNGVRWFNNLGAKNVTSVPLIDRASANDTAIVEALRAARLIYLLGGFPGHLGSTLKGSLAWQAALEAYQSGAVVGGSSAEAMVLCAYYLDPDEGRILDGLNLVHHACVIPHHNRFGKGWGSKLVQELPGVVFIGIDEQTGLIDDGPQGSWTAYGKGDVTIYRNGEIEVYQAGEGVEQHVLKL
jgi:cyanophycinase